MSKVIAPLKTAILQKLEPYYLDYWFLNTTKTLTFSAHYMGYPIIHGCDSGDFVQATVDSFLGVTSDITVATSFGSTAMGTDAYGFIIAMNGQVASAVAAEGITYLATPVPAAVQGAGTVTTALPNTLTQGFAITASGNIYGRLILTGGDAGTAVNHIRLAVHLK